MRCVRAAHCAGSTSRFIAPSENRISILGSAVLGLGWVWVGFGLARSSTNGGFIKHWYSSFRLRLLYQSYRRPPIISGVILIISLFPSTSS